MRIAPILLLLTLCSLTDPLLAGEAGSPASSELHPGAPSAPGPDTAAGALPFPLRAEKEAFEEYLSTGEAPVLTLATEKVLPFGHEVPRIRCLPLRACDLRFQAGETIVGWALGDTERWQTDQLVEGQEPHHRSHLLLKPTDYGIATNLIVVTDRRSYHVELLSPSREEIETEEPAPYASRVSWWYPQDWVHRAAQLRAERSRASAERAASVVEAAKFDPGRLNFGYQIEQPWWPSRRLGWQPTLVFDDGQRVFLRVPPRARRSDLPAVLGVLEGSDEGFPLNARLHGEWLVIPRLVDRIELVIGTGKHRRSLRIVSLGVGETR